jgi:hypothetical protein
MALTREQIREKLLNFKKKTVDFIGSLPGLEELNGELAIRELSAADTSAISGMAKSEDGYQDHLDVAGTVARGLVHRETKERIFSDLDMEAVAEFGLSVLRPIVEEIKKISGLNPTVVADAKKNSQPTPKAEPNASPTSSTETVEQPEAVEALTNS